MDLLRLYSDNPTYVCIHLTEERLTREVADRLEFVGIESITDGGPFLAYGIVQLSRRSLAELECDPIVDYVEVAAPPTGM